MSKHSAKSISKIVGKLRKEKLLKFRTPWEIYDTENSGVILIKELVPLLKNFGFNKKIKDVKDLTDELELHSNDEITFEEYVFLVMKLEDPESVLEEVDPDQDDEVIQALKFFDKENQGKINKQELKYLLMNIGGNNLTENEVELLFEVSDVKNSGVIDYRAFVKEWRSKIEKN